MAQKVSINSSVFFLETCCQCKTKFAMDEITHCAARRQLEHGSFYCPNGHAQHYVTGDTEADKLRRENDKLRQNTAYLEDRLREEQYAANHERARAIGYKGTITKIKRRAGNGVCPCCNRTFQNLKNHMSSKHPSYANSEVA